jgi:hypothetical protein
VMGWSPDAIIGLIALLIMCAPAFMLLLRKLSLKFKRFGEEGKQSTDFKKDQGTIADASLTRPRP